ncbi:hypothetical protein MTO96_033007 [Rhipicephalus appendiculatus]
MSVRQAMQLFSAVVTAALSYFKDQAGYTCDLDFASAGPTTEFMKMMQKWFTLMDVSNFQQYMPCNNEDAGLFVDVEDPRLEMLETIFLGHIEDLKNESSAGNFFSKETYHALVFETKSNVDCIRHLLTVKHFKFVLTRKMSSDPIESLFGFLRRSSRPACNDMLDVKSAVCGLEEMFKTGIVAASKESNVQIWTSFASRQLLPSQQSPTTNSGAANKILDMAVMTLKEHCLSEGSCPPNPDVPSVAMVGGFIVRAASKSVSCANCIALAARAQSQHAPSRAYRSSGPWWTAISKPRTLKAFSGAQEACRLRVGAEKMHPKAP